MTEQIEILFKEYDTLRSEVIARTNNLFQLIGVSAGFAAALLAWSGQHHLGFVIWLSTTGFLLIIVICSILVSQDIFRLATRLRELESEINTLAGKELLKWERLYSRGAPGRWLSRRKII